MTERYYKTKDLLNNSVLPSTHLSQENTKDELSYEIPQRSQKLQTTEPNEPKQHNHQTLNITWETMNYASSEDPKVWGPAFWFTLHNGAARYPIKASPIFAQNMKNFILGMTAMLPCEKCKDHAIAHIEANYRRLDEIVSGRKNLFNFFVDFHNAVNRRYGKPEMGYQEAYDLYTRKVNVTKMVYN